MQQSRAKPCQLCPIKGCMIIEIWKDIKGFEGLYQISKWAFVDKEGVETKARTNNTIECMEARS